MLTIWLKCIVDCVTKPRKPDLQWSHFKVRIENSRLYNQLTHYAYYNIKVTLFHKLTTNCVGGFGFEGISIRKRKWLLKLCQGDQNSFIKNNSNIENVEFIYAVGQIWRAHRFDEHKLHMAMLIIFFTDKHWCGSKTMTVSWLQFNNRNIS